MMPTTNPATFPSVSFQISGPVVEKWIAVLARFLNCCGMNHFGSWAISSAKASAPAAHAACGEAPCS